MVKLRDFLHPVERRENILPDKVYRQVGVRVWGKGAYERDPILGCNTKYKKFNKVRTNDVIVNKIWARNGSIAIITAELDGLYCSSEFPLFVVEEKKARLDWVRWLIKTPWFWNQCNEKSGGTSGKNRISPNRFLDINIELPPLEKQTKIFLHLDNSIPAVSDLKLSNKENRILVQHLRQSILQKAITGKLVPQNPNDEPPLELLEKIERIKKRLFAEKKIRRQKKCSTISEEEIPYKLPSGWIWARWRDITKWITYGFTKPMPHEETGIPIVTAKNIKNNKIVLENTDLTSEEAFSTLNPKDIPKEGDILLTKDGSIGRCAIVPENMGNFCVNQSVAVLWLKGIPLKKQYLTIVIESPLIQKELLKKKQGIAVPHISVTHFGKMLIPIPPLSEQERIVKKVNSLIDFCNELEEKNEGNKKSTELLMKSILKETFSITK